MSEPDYNGYFLVVGDDGNLSEVRAVATSGGAADADKIIRTGSDGLIDSTLLPASGIEQYDSYEAINAGELVNIFYDSVAAENRVRKASSTNLYQADGVALNNAGSANVSVSVQATPKSITKTSHGFTANTLLYLHASTAGAWSATPPAAGTGKLFQVVGVVLDSNTVLWEFHPPIVRSSA